MPPWLKLLLWTVALVAPGGLLLAPFLVASELTRREVRDGAREPAAQG